MWCDDGLYPRKLYVNMVNGRPNWRCACFKEVGWSDVRQVGEYGCGLMCTRRYSTAFKSDSSLHVLPAPARAAGLRWM